jgi:hypothetical protein
MDGVAPGRCVRIKRAAIRVSGHRSLRLRTAGGALHGRDFVAEFGSRVRQANARIHRRLTSHAGYRAASAGAVIYPDYATGGSRVEQGKGSVQLLSRVGINPVIWNAG